jgi:hypothetical protein
MDARSTALSSFKYSTISVYFDTTWNMFSYYIYIFVGIDVISTFFIELIIFKEVYLRTTLEVDLLRNGWLHSSSGLNGG